jgi:hypothetical protein
MEALNPMNFYEIDKRYGRGKRKIRRGTYADGYRVGSNGA